MSKRPLSGKAVMAFVSDELPPHVTIEPVDENRCDKFRLCFSETKIVRDTFGFYDDDKDWCSITDPQLIQVLTQVTDTRTDRQFRAINGFLYEYKYHSESGKIEQTNSMTGTKRLVHVKPERFDDEIAAWYLSKGQASKGAVYILEFPSDFPRMPVFVRLVEPRMQQYTGHVTVGGSICTKLLVPEGWSEIVNPTLDFLCTTLIFLLRDGNARVDYNIPYPYTEAEAKAAFTRVASDHGWSVV